jgi:hypothetical protein
MSNLLDQGIDAVRSLPQERQDAAGELLLSIAAPGTDESYRLTSSQIADIQEAVEEADRSELAADDEMNALWRYCGL